MNEDRGQRIGYWSSHVVVLPSYQSTRFHCLERNIACPVKAASLFSRGQFLFEDFTASRLFRDKFFNCLFTEFVFLIFLHIFMPLFEQRQVSSCTSAVKSYVFKEETYITNFAKNAHKKNMSHR